MSTETPWDPTLDVGNLFDPALLRDPFAWLRRMRDEEPVRWDSSLNGWVVSRYADCRTVMDDPRLMSGKCVTPEAAEAAGHEDLSRFYRVFQTVILFQDPPRHTWLRKAVSSAFTPRMSEQMRATVQEVTDELLDRVIDAGRLDLVADLAYPLPGIVILRMLGIPPEDVALFQKWTDAILPLAASPVLPPEDQIPALTAAGGEFLDYLGDLIADRRERPRDDLIGRLLTVEADGRKLDADAVIGNAIAMLAAGHETTKGAMANGIHALLENPDQYHLLQQDHDLVPSAIEEILRFQSPFLTTFRMAREDFELGGFTISKGQPVFALMAGANRDPERFTEPDRMDITRPGRRHLSFGHGMHFCLGASLGRLELDVVLRTLLRRMPNLRLSDEAPEWTLTMPVRTLSAFPVMF